MSKITSSTDFTTIKPEDLPKHLSFFADEVVNKVNGGLDFATNINCKLISITFSAGATNTSIAHGLNRLPVGYLVYGQTANITVYDGSTANTTTTLTLRSSAAGAVRLIVF